MLVIIVIRGRFVDRIAHGHSNPMLRDITTTSTRLNISLVPDCRQKPKKSETRRVKFTEEGTSVEEVADEAMTRGKKQTHSQKTEPRTPKKPKTPVKPLIGSSSTWTEDELDRFNFRRVWNIDPKQMIPGKWFDFSGLEEFPEGDTSRK